MYITGRIRTKSSANGRYLVDDSDEPFFYLADTAWSLLHVPSMEGVRYDLTVRKEQGLLQLAVVPR